MGDIRSHFFRSSLSSSSTSAKFPAWKASVRKLDLPPVCPIKGMEMSKLMPEVDTFSMDAAVGTEQVEVTWVLVGSILKPGGGGREDRKRDTPVRLAGRDRHKRCPPKDQDGGHGHWPHTQGGNTGKRSNDWRLDYRCNWRCHCGMHYRCRWHTSCQRFSQQVEKQRQVVLWLRRMGWHDPHAGAWHLLQGMLHDTSQAMVC